MAEGMLRRALIWGGGGVIIVGALVAGIILGSGSESDAATETGVEMPDQPEAGCEVDSTESCSLGLGDGLTLATTEETTITDNGDGTATVTGTLDIATGAGSIEIDDAELIVEIPPDGGSAEIIGGTGEVPFPKIGFLEGAEMLATSTGLFGTDYGRDIAHLGAFVNPDTKYIWVSFSDGMNVETGFATMFPGVDTSALPSSFNVPLGVSATMVIDPLDPYVYIGGACPEFKTNDDDADSDATTSTTTSSATTTTTIEAPDDDAPVTIGPAEGAGEDCGIGFSLNGLIPFTPPDIEELPETVAAYSGHIVINGEVPLGSTGLAIDGVTVQRIETTGYRLDGFGDVIATVPLIKGLIDLEIPLGDAAAGMEVTALESVAYAAGGFGGSQAPLVLPLPIPIEIPNEQSQEVHISALIGGEVDSAGVFQVDPDSSLEINGSQGVGVSTFAELLDIELEDFQTTTGRLVLNKDGAFLEASTNFGLHPSVELGAGASVTARIDANSLEDSYIEMVGLMTFAAVSLDGESQLRLDRDGLQAHGLLTTAISSIEMKGMIGPAGLDLRGTADLRFPVGIGDSLADDVDTALIGAIAEVESLDVEIDRITEEIKEDRRQRSSDFQAANTALENAQGEVNKINGDLSKNRTRINELKDLIDGVCAGKTGIALTACQVANAPQVALWSAEIAALETANLALEGARLVAIAALEAAQIVLDGILAGLDAIPVDTDPRLVALYVSRDSALAVLETTRSVANTVGAGGTLGGSVDLQLGISGLGGAAVIEWCDSDGCTTLVGAELRLDTRFEACLAVFGVPDVCAEF